MSETDEDKLIETIIRKLIILRGKDIHVEFARDGLDPWDIEVDRILMGEQEMTPAERLAIGRYVSEWRALQSRAGT